MAGVETPGQGSSVTLKAAGITLVGVVLSIGVTVGAGIRGAWWVRLLVGAGVTVAVLVLIKVGSRSERGPLSRLANWVIGAPGS